MPGPMGAGLACSL